MLFLIEPFEPEIVSGICVDKGCYLRKCKLCRTLWDTPK